MTGSLFGICSSFCDLCFASGFFFCGCDSYFCFSACYESWSPFGTFCHPVSCRPTETCVCSSCHHRGLCYAPCRSCPSYHFCLCHSSCPSCPFYFGISFECHACCETCAWTLSATYHVVIGTVWTWIGETWNAFPIATFAETLTGAATLCGANVNFATGNALNENDVTWILDAETLTVESANAAFQMGMAHGAASIAARAISSLTVARVDDSKACRHLPSWNPSPLLQTVVSPQLYHLRISSLPSRGVHGSQARGLPPFQALAGPEIALIAEWLVFQHLRPLA